jgi:hypothetical protein
LGVSVEAHSSPQDGRLRPGRAQAYRFCSSLGFSFVTNRLELAVTDAHSPVLKTGKTGQEA